MAQTDLMGKIIDDQDALVARCLEYREQKASLKIIYPGAYFNVTISADEADTLSEISHGSKQRAFVVSKMKRAKPKEALPGDAEGQVFQDDMNLFMKVLFVVGTEHMSPETYKAIMAERKKEEIPHVATFIQLTAVPALNKKKGKKSIEDGLKEAFGEENVKVE